MAGAFTTLCAAFLNDMKSLRHITLAAAVLTMAGMLPARADALHPTFISETEREFFTSGDFDGDGKTELAIIDKEKGRIRIGVRLGEATYLWDKYLNSGIKDLTGVGIGRFFDAKKDAFAVSSADGNLIALVEAISVTQGATPVVIPPPGLGPNTLAGMSIGDVKPLQDLLINTTYNTPEANKVTLFRNDAGKFTKGADVPMPGTVAHVNRFPLKAGGPELLCAVIGGDAGDTFRADSYASGKPETVATIKGLPAGSDYLVGSFRGSPLRDVVFYNVGEKKLTLYSVEEVAGKFQFGAAKSFELAQAIKSVSVIPVEGVDKIVSLFGTGEVGGVFTFDVASGPKQILELKPEENTVLSGSAPFANGFVLASAPALGKIKYSTRYQSFTFKGDVCTPASRGGLPSLADTDDATVPPIRKVITANLKEKAEAEMKPYTNTIPGTPVQYVMLPIPGGEFVMGSPATEKNRKDDEGPQHKIKVEPFWMEQCEVTWNEYELFMYPDEERKYKDTLKTDPEYDRLSDACTRPSKPYVEMSFGMGKDGFPAIAMTHHAANKYCHWLSAKTGHFYRLPTEAEWEYACRAGTTTTYFFGDDASKLSEYAWFEANSDFKYQKVGKKKPNPWGLFDMYGNVTEWCLDQYDAGFYADCVAKGNAAPWNRATQPYPHSVKGGSWDDAAPACRSAARRGSDRAWKMQDPQLPKSYWYLSDAQFVGFRIIRPLKVPSQEEMVKYWISGTEKD